MRLDNKSKEELIAIIKIKNSVIRVMGATEFELTKSNESLNYKIYTLKKSLEDCELNNENLIEELKLAQEDRDRFKAIAINIIKTV